MDKALMKKWIKTLRSGKYVQGTGRLFTEESIVLGKPRSFCCLGVLCDITKRGEFNPAGTWYNIPEGEVYPDVVGYIPTPILNQIGLDLEDTRELAYHNDRGYTFEEIAEILECILFFEE